MNKIRTFVCILVASFSLLDAQIDLRSGSIYIVFEGQVFKATQGSKPSPTSCFPLPGSISPGKLFKFGNERVWLGDGKNIFYRVCGSSQGSKVNLPQGLIGYSNFEVLENGSLCIWAPAWVNEKGERKTAIQGSEYPWGLIINPENGKIEFEFEKVKIEPQFDFYDAVLHSEVITSSIENYAVIAGKYSGRLTLYEFTSKTARTIDVINENDLPPKGPQRVNNGPSITQLVPIPGGDVIIGLRLWLPANGDTKATWFDCYKILNISTLTLSESEILYEGIEPNSHLFWVDWDRKPHLLKNIKEYSSGAKQ